MQHRALKYLEKNNKRFSGRFQTLGVQNGSLMSHSFSNAFHPNKFYSPGATTEVGVN